MSKNNEIAETHKELQKSAAYSTTDTAVLFGLRQTWAGEPLNPWRTDRSRQEAQKVLTRICLELDSPERAAAVGVLDAADVIVNEEYARLSLDNESSER